MSIRLPEGAVGGYGVDGLLIPCFPSCICCSQRPVYGEEEVCAYCERQTAYGFPHDHEEIMAAFEDGQAAGRAALVARADEQERLAQATARECERMRVEYAKLAERAEAAERQVAELKAARAGRAEQVDELLDANEARIVALERAGGIQAALGVKLTAEVRELEAALAAAEAGRAALADAARSVLAGHHSPETLGQALDALKAALRSDTATPDGQAFKIGLAEDAAEAREDGARE